jgi:putative transposase
MIAPEELSSKKRSGSVGGEKLVRREIAGLSWLQREQASMGEWVRIAGWSVVSALKRRGDLALERVALRHQLMVLGRQPGRVRLKDCDRLFWVWLSRLWPGWQRALVLVQPATVVRSYRKGFRVYRRRKSGCRCGRPRIDPQVRKLIRDLWRANPTWGKPRIQAELHKIGIEVSDSTARRY